MGARLRDHARKRGVALGCSVCYTTVQLPGRSDQLNLAWPGEQQFSA
jgi:hypothetical protein